MPICDINGTCYYNPSPGFDGHLHPANTFAVWFFKRWHRLGDPAFRLLPDLSNRQRLLLLEQMYKLVELQRTPAEAGVVKPKPEGIEYDN